VCNPRSTLNCAYWELKSEKLHQCFWTASSRKERKINQESKKMFFTLAWIKVPIAGLVLPAFYRTKLRSQSGANREQFGVLKSRQQYGDYEPGQISLCAPCYELISAAVVWTAVPFVPLWKGERWAGAKWTLNTVYDNAGCTFKFDACAKSRQRFAFLAFSTPELFSIAHEHKGSSGRWPYAWNRANAETA